MMKVLRSRLEIKLMRYFFENYQDEELLNLLYEYRKGYFEVVPNRKLDVKK